ncbi:alpha/beta fold hydrolase [Nocardia salmonicida]|uniref:alpha/beta fold hydrolase n=1 Tax=Nocardia salmonicida TaxID=53431 RepID=UPI0036ACDDB4
MTAPIVLLHGLGCSPAAWDRIRPILQTRGRAVASPALASPATVERDADFVAASLGAVPAIVVGHSRGGLVATALAERHPRLVDRLVLVNTPATAQSRMSARASSERLLGVPGLGHIAWRTMTPGMASRGMASAFAPGFPTPAQFVRDLRATRLETFLSATRAIDTYLATRPLWDRLADLNCPIDVVAGQLDQRIDPASYLESAAMPNVRLTVLPRAGHTPIWEDPEAVTTVISRESE